MTRVARFAARDDGVAARFQHFADHLRAHGVDLGVAETHGALAALNEIECWDPTAVRLALRATCAKSAEQYARFDDLFDAFWMNAGRVRHRPAPPPNQSVRHTRTTAMTDGPEAGVGAGGAIDSPEDGLSDGATEAGGDGKLVASGVDNLMRRDLRELVAPQDVRAAETVAIRLGAALRDTRSRRRKAAKKGEGVDFRRAIRLSLSTGGEPIRLPRRKRPDRAVKIAALCDVSGSMTVYSRVFLAFLAGLMRADPAADAYLFHTRLVRIADALRDDDPMRALNRVTLLAEGFGGGSKIGGAIERYARTYARRFVDGRTVVLILSDGYDTEPPARLSEALLALKRRGCRVVWLNPLKSWRDYAPIAGGMAAALPHLDHFAAASTLNDLAALEQEFARL